MKKHTLPSILSAAVTALLCGAPAVSAADIPSYAVFGDHSEDDPLNPYYIFGEALLNGTKKLPTNSSYYFTGQIFIPGEIFTGVIPSGYNVKYLYSKAERGYFVWYNGDPLSVTKAEEFIETAEPFLALYNYDTRHEPTLVYCTKMPSKLQGDLNGDGKVTIEDAKRLLNSVVYAYVDEEYAGCNITEHLYPCGDVNGNGETDIVDAKYILDYSVYTLTFGKEPTWSEITAK